ncbi:MAG: bifunctional metallophosphatase/5'-nucleotidase [Bacteroidales bacterium]
MYRYIRILLTTLLFTTLLFSCSEYKVEDGVYNLKIFATNDLHGRFFDSLYIQSPEKQVHNYSLASVARYIRNVRDTTNENSVILLDIGDHLQGDNSVFYYNFIDIEDEHIFSKVANYLKFDAVVVGNHDIEAGHRVYDKLIEELEMPYLAANAIELKTDKPYFEPYTILNRDGVKIAIIGMTNPNIPNWLSPHLWEGIEFEEIVSSLEYWVNYVRKNENPHIVIAAMHAGLGSQEVNNKENPARFIAKNIEGIDIIFAAHDHKVTAEKIVNEEREVWVLEGGSRASMLSMANITLTIEGGKIASTNITGYNISMSGVKADSLYNQLFREEFLTVQEFTKRPVGMLNNSITSRDAYFGPSEYIDMLHTLQLKASGAHISFAAPLSLDLNKKRGVLNYQDLLDIYPFENQLNVIEMTGLEIKNYLEYSYSKWVNPNPIKSGHLLNLREGGNGNRGHFNSQYFNFDSAAGILYGVDITKGDGERVNIISLANGDIFNLESKYKVALTSYRASGGGDLLILGAGIPKEELSSRLVARLADIRQLIFNQIQVDGSLEAKKLNHWKFIPEEIVTKLAERDYSILF